MIIARDSGSINETNKNALKTVKTGDLFKTPNANVKRKFFFRKRKKNELVKVKFLTVWVGNLDKLCT